jgi:hypothetical protein
MVPPQQIDSRLHMPAFLSGQHSQSQILFVIHGSLQPLTTKYFSAEAGREAQ